MAVKDSPFALIASVHITHITGFTSLLSHIGPVHYLGGHIVIGRENPSFSVLTIHMVHFFQNFTLAFEKSSLETEKAK